MEIALRAYVTHEIGDLKSYAHSRNVPANREIVSVLDTETTVDQYQNLLFGSFALWVTGKLHRFIIFHSDRIGKDKLAVLENHVGAIQDIKIQLMSRSQFIDELFHPYVLDARAMVVGFNLPFDLSRLAVNFGYGRGGWRGGFTFTLSRNGFRPPIRIKSLDSTKAFIGFAKPSKRNQRHPRPHYKGCFIDLRTLGFALTNEKLTLETACEHFQTGHRKTTAEEHGKITPGYIEYNINDNFATHDLYTKMIERYNSFLLELSPEKVYSPASIGKQYLKEMGIKSFLEKNPDFSPDILGHIMTTYYGGRSEVRIRKKPVKVRYLDFTSMYPALFSLMNLWCYVIAERIECVDSTDRIKRLVRGADLQTLREPTLWKDMTAIVQIKPDGEALPVRSHYGDKHVYNMGINYLTSTEPLWYTLPDVLSSKILAGKSPKILRAIKFAPVGTQIGLSPVRIIGDYVVSPKEDLFRRLIELRKETQRKRDQKEKNSPDHQILGSLQNQLKIIANSCSYGIFIEVNTEDEECDADVYGLEHFKSKASKRESFGYFFHPIIATILTSGARLLLAMGESWLVKHGGYYAFCDTDSMAVSPFHWKKLQQFFEPLNPFEGSEFLKLEKENFDENGQLRDLWFYGISAKRYVLYVLDEKGEPQPVKWSSHGLGQLVHEKESEWEKQLWTNILRHAHGKISKTELLEKYAGEHAVAKLALTKPNLLQRVRSINKGRQNESKVKPYNFVLVGSPTTFTRTGRPIVPVTPFVRPYDLAPHQPFIDARSGKFHSKHTEVYWRKLDSFIEAYIDHPESKFENGYLSGTMRRRHICVDHNAIAYIGKESNELHETEILGVLEGPYVKYKHV